MTQPSPLPPIVAQKGLLVETGPANSVGMPAHRHHLVWRRSIRASQTGYGVFVCHTPGCHERRELPAHFEDAMRRDASGRIALAPLSRPGPPEDLLPFNWMARA